MLIGFDFDNTIVCYDRAIAELSKELRGLPTDLPRTKTCVRDYLRAQNRELEWTQFQGKVYGPGMVYAQPFPDAIQVMKTLNGIGHSLRIISHRSLRPYSGPPYDLHEAAYSWIEKQLRSEGLFKEGCISFHTSVDEKIAAIATYGCDVFLDDLGEVLDHNLFPKKTQGILFYPSANSSVTTGNLIGSWGQLLNLIDKLS